MSLEHTGPLPSNTSAGRNRRQILDTMNEAETVIIKTLEDLSTEANHRRHQSVVKAALDVKRSRSTVASPELAFGDAGNALAHAHGALDAGLPVAAWLWANRAVMHLDRLSDAESCP